MKLTKKDYQKVCDLMKLNYNQKTTIGELKDLIEAHLAFEEGPVVKLREDDIKERSYRGKHPIYG
jgi:hypothetical protein